jgi:hypothetical protein
MLRSLRSTLALLWILVAVVCCALGLMFHGLFELGISGQITQVRESLRNSAESIERQFNLYRSGFSEVPNDA